MPALPTSRRPVIGAAITAAGALTLIAVALFYLAPGFDNWWIYVLAELALVVVLVVLGTSGLFGASRVVFAVGAVGWMLVAIAALIAGSLGVIGLVGEVLALLGGLGSGILALHARAFTRIANVGFLVAMVVTSLYLLNSVIPFVPGIFAAILVLLYGAALLLAGVFILQRR
jgi:hypothetical protein